MAKISSPAQPPLPQPYLARMEQLLGEEYPLFLQSYAAPPSAGLRVNMLKVSVEDFRKIAPFALQEVPWAQTGFVIQNPTPALALPNVPRPKEEEGWAPGRHPYHAAGLYYLQEPAAMAVAEALKPRPGERVLDLAAAPGGKSTHLASLLQGQGLLVANEIHPRRVWDLAENLERWGAHNVVITNETPERLAEQCDFYFDRVLLDAPCSGEGLFRKTPAARLEWSEGLVQSCALRQSAILEQAARLVRPGGYLAYSTCTFAPQEDEAVIERFLRLSQQRGEYCFEIAAIEHLAGLDPGRPEWIPAASNPMAEEAEAWAAITGEGKAGRANAVSAARSLAQARRIWPHRSPGEGHFIALLRRSDGGASRHTSRPPTHSKRGKTNLDQAQAVRLFMAFVQETFQDLSLEGELVLAGGYLYAQPAALPPLQGLKVIHPGLWLGTVKKDRFEPSHALALAVRSEQVQRNLILEPGSAACSAYLRGETLPAEGMVGGGAGWCLVSVLGGASSYPLGWGKRTGDVVKNRTRRD